MTEPAAAAVQQAGWRPPAVARFLCSGRDWAAVRAYYRALAAGDAAIGDLGLQLAAPLPPPPAPCPAASAAGSPGSAAQPEAQQGSDATQREWCIVSRDRQALAESTQQQRRQQQQLSAAEQQHPAGRPHERSTWKVHISYYGPAFG